VKSLLLKKREDNMTSLSLPTYGKFVVMDRRAGLAPSSGAIRRWVRMQPMTDSGRITEEK
jgi:hypothetical protein